VGVAAAAPSTSLSSYTQFTVPFVYVTADTPDTCVIQIQIVGPGTGGQATPQVGSYFLLDDIAFTGATNVASRQASVPTVLQLDQNYPNPFNPTTTIQFSISKAGIYSLQVFNILGQKVASLLDKEVSPGVYKVQFDASNLTSGMYIYTLRGANVNISQKMMLLK
jgi:Secretion system C-terminal sorting domain